MQEIFGFSGSQGSCFNEKLQEILADPATICGDCLPVVYNDDMSGYPRLSSVICDIIGQELEAEGYVLPPPVV